MKNGHFPGLLNALYVYAMGHPDAFPGGDARGMRAVSGAVQQLLGVRLDGMVVINLAGFVSLVDELGGLWIDIPARLVDDKYPLEDGSKLIKVAFDAGCQKLDGRMALAYARSRHQDSDYGRMHRQQTVLLSLRREVDPVALVPKVPAPAQDRPGQPVDDPAAPGPARPCQARGQGGRPARRTGSSSRLRGIPRTSPMTRSRGSST